MAPPCVLIVEDHADTRELWRTVLEHFGYSVLEAENGAEGVQAAVEHRPRIILMDLAMPVLDGWQAMQRLKRSGGTADIPVILVSAHVGGPEILGAAAAGFTSVLEKPLSPRQLVSEIERLIGAPRS